MSKETHNCSLPSKDTSGFPKLPPTASCGKRLIRHFRRWLALNPNNAKCKEFFRNKSSQVAEQKRYAKSPYFYVIHPFSNLCVCLETLFFLTWFHSIIIEPLTGFKKVSAYPEKPLFYKYVVVSIQRILIFFWFFLGYIDQATKQTVIQPKSIAIRYLKTYFFFDITATKITKRIIYLILEYRVNHINTIINVIIILCYGVRMNSILRFLKDISKYLMPKKLQFIIVHVVRTYIILHLATCMLYGIPNNIYVENWPKESWLVQAKIHGDSGSSYLQRYLEVLLVATCYFFGASHSMYDVVMPNEQACLSAVTIFGRLYTLFLLADVLKMFGIADISESNYEKQLTRLEEYMNSKNLPENLRKRLLKFYEYKLQRHYFNEAEIFSTLSDHLRTELYLFSARKLIKKVHVFQSLPKATLGSIIASMKLETFSPRDVIIQIGKPVQDIYFISSGTVAVLNKYGKELCHLEDGDEFGIISTITDQTQKYKYEAVETTELFYINKALFLEFLEAHHEVMKYFYEAVKERISKFEFIENQLKKGGPDFMSELQSGKILEHPHKRPMVAD